MKKSKKKSGAYPFNNGFGMQAGLWLAVFYENDVFVLDGRNDIVQVRFAIR